MDAGSGLVEFLEEDEHLGHVFFLVLGYSEAELILGMLADTAVEHKDDEVGHVGDKLVVLLLVVTEVLVGAHVDDDVFLLVRELGVEVVGHGLEGYALVAKTLGACDKYRYLFFHKSMVCLELVFGYNPGDITHKFYVQLVDIVQVFVGPDIGMYEVVLFILFE